MERVASTIWGGPAPESRANKNKLIKLGGRDAALLELCVRVLAVVIHPVLLESPQICLLLSAKPARLDFGLLAVVHEGLCPIKFCKALVNPLYRIPR